MHTNAPPTAVCYDLQKRTFIWMDAILASTLLFIPNLFLFFIFLPTAPLSVPAIQAEPPTATANDTTYQYIVMGAGLNLVFLGLLVWLRHYVLVPMVRSFQLIQSARSAILQDTSPPQGALICFNFRMLVSDILRFTSTVQEHYRKHQELGLALEETRRLLHLNTEQQQQLLQSTTKEISSQYNAVISYAHYLDEHIEQRRGDPQLRFDFDDVCESSFYLRLMAGAMRLLYHPNPIAMEPISLAQVMQDTLLALSPALDRRSMSLTSSEVSLDVVARSDPSILTHVVWMMLFGLVRYAAEESTLRLRCFQSQSSHHVWLSIVISELSPGKMTPDERTQHFARQLNSQSPHMFAETMRAHASLQLAELLLARVEGKIEVLPLTPTACEISLILPATANSTAQSL